MKVEYITHPHNHGVDVVRIGEPGSPLQTIRTLESERDAIQVKHILYNIQMILETAQRGEHAEDRLKSIETICKSILKYD